MNVILRFLNRKNIRIAELERAAESHNREIGGHKASYTRLKKEYEILQARLDSIAVPSFERDPNDNEIISERGVE